jgi:hypothetical protein
MSSKTKEISWRDPFGSPYRYGLHPAMLTEAGHNVTATVHLKGQSVAEGKTSVVIHLDNNYVVEYISQLVIKKLFFENYQQFESLMKDAWDFYENNRK